MSTVKQVYFDKRANSEISKFPKSVQAKIRAFTVSLERYGYLEEPCAKKIGKELFEIRIRSRSQWRVIYAYAIGEVVIIISGFQKKTQKTPLREIIKAQARLREYKQ